MSKCVTTDHSVVNDDNVNVRANHCVINGNGCNITGNHCVVNGDRCNVRGRFNVINGDRCIVHGENAVINGKHCIGPGVSSSTFSQMLRSSINVRNGRSVGQGAGSFSFGIGRMRASTGGTVVNVSASRGLGNTIKIVKSDGVYEYTGGGQANVRDGRIFLDGADITEACKVSSTPTLAASSASSASSAVAGKRKKEEEDGPRKKKETSPYPVDQKASKAEDEEKACCVCMENKIDTRLKPCGHINLCIDCAKAIYKDETKRKCPICNETIKKIQTAYL